MGKSPKKTLGPANVNGGSLYYEVAGRKLQQIATDYSGWHFRNENPVQGLKPPANDRLEEIAIPTLVIVGQLNLPFYNLPIADTLAQHIRDARKVVIPGAGHMANMEDPLRFNEVVVDFLKEVDASNTLD